MVFTEITRKQAFLTHLAVSTGIFVIISYLIFFHWFPEFYFYLDGGIRAITTIFFVDVVLGPGLTLLVFKPGKKGLKFDMTMILLFQFSALFWGVNSVYAERSGATVFYYGKFSCIAHDDTKKMDMDVINAGPAGRQRLSFLQHPDAEDDLFDFIKEAFDHQSGEIYYYAEKITALDESSVKRLQNYQLDLSKLAEENEASAKKVELYLADHADDIEFIKLFPLSCRYGFAIAAYDTRQMKITDWIKMEKTLLRGEAQDEPLPVEQSKDVENGNKS